MSESTLKPIKGLSLFANVGIAETYFEDLNIDIVVANELLDSRAAFYKHLHPNTTHVVPGDITDNKVFNTLIRHAEEEMVNFIMATPPCQGMSVAGRMEESDPRNSLIVKAMEAFSKLDPDWMLIENVPQMLRTFIIHNGKKIKITDFIEEVAGKTHNVLFNVFDAADYGTPQTRKRAFVRIFRKGLTWEDPVKQAKITVKDAIADLPTLEAGQDSGIPFHKAKPHNANHINWMKHTPSGKTAFDNPVHYPQKDGRRIKGFSTTYRRMAWDKPAPTITMANGSVSSQYNVHPGRDNGDGTYSDARVLTHLELFRLEGLPDNWNVPKWASENLVRQVIGEAIPPKLVKAIVAGMARQ